MTTVQEELEQSTEDITNAIEESSQRNPNLNDVCLRNSSNLQKDSSLNKLLSQKKMEKRYSSKYSSVNIIMIRSCFYFHLK